MEIYFILILSMVESPNKLLFNQLIPYISMLIVHHLQRHRFIIQVHNKTLNIKY